MNHWGKEKMIHTQKRGSFLFTQLRELQHKIEELEVARLSCQDRKKHPGESKEIYKRFFDLCPIGMASIDLKRCYRSVNQAYCRMLQREEAELIGNDYIPLIIPHKQQKQEVEFFNRILAQMPEDRSFESVNVRTDGREILVRYHVEPVRDKKGRVAEFVLYSEDMTEQRRSENDFVERTKQLNTLCSLGKKINSMASKDELLPWIAEQATQLLHADLCSYRLREGDFLVRGGGTKEGLELMTEERIKIGESLGGMAALLKKPVVVSDHLSSDPGYTAEQKRELKASHFRSFLGVPMMADGEVIGVLNVYTKKSRRFTTKEIEVLTSFADIAAIALENARLFKDLRRARIDLERSGKELEEKVEQRTKELQDLHNQLIHAERLAATGRLGASIAHEINNPLQAIDNFISLVFERLDEKSVEREYLGLAKEGIDRIAMIVRQLLIFHHPETVRVEAVDIKSVVEKVLLMTKNQLSLNRIRVKKRFSSSLPKVRASAQQLHQVLLNLVLNAQDAMPKGGELTIRTEAEEDDVLIMIEDTGIGIRAEILNHIFEPFFTTKKGMGTGLGLSVSHGIVRAHGGDILVESREQQGTKFIIKLPADSSK
jgi:PAS domain S-box-containing protein